MGCDTEEAVAIPVIHVIGSARGISDLVLISAARRASTRGAPHQLTNCSRVWIESFGADLDSIRVVFRGDFGGAGAQSIRVSLLFVWGCTGLWLIQSITCSPWGWGFINGFLARRQS